MSKNLRIERLQFTNFRGATKSVVFQFQPNHSIVLIFGENGTGKSTIADALDFVCNSDFGSLRLRSGTTPRTHIVAAQGNASDLEVEMVYGGNTWRATLQNGKPVTTPPQAPRAFVLRRTDITRIMEANDSERYKSLQEFITVPKIENAESTLRASYKTVENELQQAIQQKLTAETTLQEFWIAEGQPNSDYITWARTAIQKSLTILKQQINIHKTLLKALDDAVHAEQILIAANTSLQQVESDYLVLENQLHQASQTERNADLVTTLQAAQSYLTRHPETSSCPVCAKPEPHAALLAQIDAQLAQLRQIQTLRQQLEQRSSAVQQAKGAFSAAHSAWHNEYTNLIQLLPTASAKVLNGVDIAAAATANDTETHTTLQQLVSNRASLIQRIAQAEKIVNQHNALTTHLATIDQLSATMQGKYVLAEHLKAMLAIVEEERKLFVENTINSISDTVTQLYQRIHPGEPIGNLSFGLKKNAKASLTLSSTFGSNNDVSPAAYYSEAHLDTLGLCVYLALAKVAGNALVVLDDVLTSVDDPHLDRVIDLIRDEAPNFGHVIITTHSRAWFNRMRQGQGMQAQLIELYGWDLHNGMYHSAAPLPIDELRTAVQSQKLDRQAVASCAGILLEQMLDELALRFNCALPYKHPARYTLGELAQCFDKKLQKLLQTEQLDAAGNITAKYELHLLITAATTDILIRNQVGAHFNPDAAGISDAMVKQFGENVVKLADALLCPHCRQLARKNKSGSYWECGGSCGKIRLYPLHAP